MSATIFVVASSVGVGVKGCMRGEYRYDFRNIIKINVREFIFYLTNTRGSDYIRERKKLRRQLS
jgi:hypothetical protein